MDVNEFVKKYNEIPVVDRKTRLSDFIATGRLPEIYGYVSGDDARLATRILADADSKISEFIRDNIQSALGLLRAEDPKVRMHAAQIIGNTHAAEYLDELVTALEEEQIMYVLPSYILAIGKAKNVRAKEFLESYTLRSEIDKHLFEEKSALEKALAHFTPREKANVRILPSDIIVLSTPNPNVTWTQCKNMGLDPRKFGKNIAISGLKSFGDVYKIRAFCDAYIYLGKCATVDLPAFLAKREEAILQRTGVLSYRLEVKSNSHKVRLDIIKKCVAACKKLKNSPSSYSIEVLIVIDESTAEVYINPLVDTRFLYRKKAIAASISPGVAACVCAYASEFFDPDASVLDNFCGSGTLLFERGYYPHHRLTGVDINQTAIRAATENNRTSFAHVQFHHMDALKFTARKYDEVITNMPFGLRVGSHAKNEKLYKAFFDMLPGLLNKDGTVILYTHEKHLTTQLLKQTEDLELQKRTTFEAGGLYPAVFIIKKMS